MTSSPPTSARRGSRRSSTPSKGERERARLDLARLARLAPLLSDHERAQVDALLRAGPSTLPHNYGPRAYQRPLWDALTRRDAAGKLDPVRRVDAVMHRRAGKDFTAWNAFILLASEWRVGTYFYCLPTYSQAREVIWEGMTSDPLGEARSLRFLDCIPEDRIARVGKRLAINKNRMSVKLTNGSVLRLVGADSYDRVVGTNPVAVCFSEWSLTNPEALEYFRPMITNNDGLICWLYTPRGHNHAKRTHDRMQELQRREPARYYSVKLTVDDTRAIKPEAIENDRREGMSDVKVQQEYYCDFDVANEGTYWGRQITELRQAGHVGDFPHDPRFAVHTVMDIGLSDHTAIWFVQVVGGTVRLIDYYADHGYGADHYAQLLETYRLRRKYRYGTHYGPHDIGKRSQNDGKTYQQAAREAGLELVRIPLRSFDAGIEAARAMLPRCRFNAPPGADPARAATTQAGLESLEAYSKLWNEALKVWGDKPRHDQHSHPADAFRYLASVIDHLEATRKPREAQRQEDWF